MTSLLTKLAAEYRQYSEEMVRAVRYMNDLDAMTDADVDRASAAVLEARLRRDQAAERYIAESEKLRSKKCGHDIEALIVTCSECCRVNDYVPEHLRKAIGWQKGRV